MLCTDRTLLIYSRGMTDHDKAAARREIADALLNALNRRHEVLDVIVDADDRPAAIEAVAGLLGTSHAAAEAVVGLSFAQITKDSRRAIAAELDDLNSQLSFTVLERPAASGESLDLRPFAAETDRDIFVARTTDVGASGDGSGAPAADVDDEIRAALGRVDAEEAAWFVALEGDQKVGMVFGELSHGEVNVRIWIHPDFRKRGYGTAALRKCRSEMATYFPAVPMVVRAPGALPRS
ncbi:Acetyltransferase (GNAT) domain-containing protein [Mycobacterium sp. 88mf]|nr:Acetyltransferase (GNAT) domain-containing protein [Mycobacterium sp. 88mf]SFF90866.1 Acetyltransferase (GNAT) domain-containing protein [Mycobacterium sp. 455mf]